MAEFKTQKSAWITKLLNDLKNNQSYLAIKEILHSPALSTWNGDKIP